jgi:ribonuclease Y
MPIPNMPMSPVALAVAIIVAAVVAFVIGFPLGIRYRKKVSEKEISSAEDEAKRIINEAIKNAESKKREATLEAKEEILKQRSEYEKEVKERRADLQKQERRLQQKEENLDKKTDSIEKKEELLSQKSAELDAQKDEVEGVKKAQTEMLERISGFTADQAKDYLISQVETEVTHETAMKIKEIEAKAKDEADERAKEIIATAIQRCAADQVSEITVSVVPLPNDEMKGRIIGREGRNIRTIETMTGVDLIIDDTPEAITVSCFEPVRREIARLALEKLIADGRIHSTRIEEMVEKAKREVDAVIKAEGERATFETGVRGLHPELVKMLGRLHYRTSYGQNVLQHSIEVSHIAGLMAAELGADVAAAKRAGLLHDLGKSVDHEMEGSHVELGVEFARKYREKEDIIHAIQAHHGDVEPKTLVACLVQAADAVSAARPGARRENLENYIKRLEKLEEITSSYPGVEKSYAIQAGREIRVMIKPEEVSEDQMVILARDMAKRIEDEMEYPGQIKVNLIRETKAVEYAK